MSDLPSGSIKQGSFKIVAGPAALAPLVPAMKSTFDVTLDDDGLRCSHPRHGSCSIGLDEIESIERHGSAFVLGLRSGGRGKTFLTCAATDAQEAGEWVSAISNKLGQAPASVSVGTPAATACPPPVEPPSAPITIKYSTPNNGAVSQDYDFLVIACDPRSLKCNYTKSEQSTFDKIQNFYFRTTLLQVPVNKSNPPQHTVVLSPALLGKMDGSVYAFRNESAKQFGFEIANTKMNSNLITVYQISQDTLKDDQFLSLLEKDLKTLPWWPFGDLSGSEIHTHVYTPYFNHFGQHDLGELWTMLDRQGDNRTMLVHGTTCFESILHCWGYGKLLMAQPRVVAKLPADKAARIAVIGAGASGLLFSRLLRKSGYANIDILESTDRSDGKTHTISMQGPYPEPDLPPGREATICELGACYMSASYTEMLQDLAEYLQDNPPYDFSASPSFRGIVTGGELAGPSKVVNFPDYVLAKALEMQGLPSGWTWEAKLALAAELALYGFVHYMNVGSHLPIPLTRPASLDGDLGHQTFEEFLIANDLTALIGIFQYAYEAQGYGALDRIAAFYGLVWITPAITWAILADAFDGLLAAIGIHLDAPLALGAFRKGWGDMWKQMLAAEQFKPIYNADITSIVRPINGV